MVQFGEGLWWGVSRCGFSWGSLQFFLGHFHENLNIRILSSSPVDCHPFWADWVKGGVCGHVQKSEAHALGCRPQGESSQGSSNLPQTYRIVSALDSGILKKWKQCWTMQASYGCLVGHVHGGVRILVSPP